jgi:phospholipid/cholesterol/gamma-HCH transport system substrate-binding protein
MQQTRAVELGTGMFVFMGILALFFLTTRVTTFDPYTGEGG